MVPTGIPRADKGKASIYYGGAVLDENPDVIFTGEASNDRFGESVSNAGDINADGYSDVIIGASGYSSYTGRSYIYFGGASMDISADVTRREILLIYHLEYLFQMQEILLGMGIWML
ncbi:MAG: integrin alpha [Ignavibacteria bacterium]